MSRNGVVRAILFVYILLLFGCAISAYNRGNIYYKKGQYDQAIKDYTKAIEIDPMFKVAYNNRGNAYADKGQHDQAIKDYSKAIEIDPMDAKAYDSRGATYDDKGQYDQAISDFTKAIELNPMYAVAYGNRGFTYIVKLVDKNRGCTDLKQACELGVCEKYDLAKSNGDCK